jgi:hypothetical protein
LSVDFAVMPIVATPIVAPAIFECVARTGRFVAQRSCPSVATAGAAGLD